MKNNIFILFLTCLIMVSCDESYLLKEKPLDFYTIDNAYVTSDDYQTALNRLYDQARRYRMTNNEGEGFEIYLFGTDLSFNTIEVTWPLNTYATITPISGYPLATWRRMYQLIYDANVIITRIETAGFDESIRIKMKAEALFFRAYAYSYLAHMYGGVPLLLEEITVPRRDMIRDTRENVYKQCATDLEYAVQNLDDVDKVKDGQVNKAAAGHLLSEIYISLGEYDKAIAAATAVIDHPALGLMTERFGRKKDEPGDVYSDLFRYGNYNRSSGNTESLWVIQYDYMNQGSPGTSWDGDLLATFTVCYATMMSLDDGKAPFPAPYAHIGGWGIGWLKQTDHVDKGIWGSDFNKDMRNSEYNIIRDAQVMNPDSKYYGMWLEADNLVQDYDRPRNWYPIYTKTSRWNDFPAEAVVNPSTGEVNYDPAMNKDTYVMRLAETYLLRAEAYLGKGDKVNAAKDINVVRARVHATPATPEEIDMEYILDERLRELCWEEPRARTLLRTGTLYDRTVRYNPLSSTTIKPHNNLYPIPYSEIERNTLEKLEQNQGYTN